MRGPRTKLQNTWSFARAGNWASPKNKRVASEVRIKTRGFLQPARVFFDDCEFKILLLTAAESARAQLQRMPLNGPGEG
jgi:hypothetical protein